MAAKDLRKQRIPKSGLLHFALKSYSVGFMYRFIDKGRGVSSGLRWTTCDFPMLCNVFFIYRSLKCNLHVDFKGKFGSQSDLQKCTKNEKNSTEYLVSL